MTYHKVHSKFNLVLLLRIYVYFVHHAFSWESVLRTTWLLYHYLLRFLITEPNWRKLPHLEKIKSQIHSWTRMHCSRMCTVRSSSHVYPSMHWAEGCVCIPACTGWGVSARGVSVKGVYIPACTEADTPPDRILDPRLWKYYLGNKGNKMFHTEEWVVSRLNTLQEAT